MWKFIKSSSEYSNWYFHNFIEICFIGRSNTGKSSLINSLANNSKLAKVSKTPGRTQLINYFETNNGKIIVDLPGYGYANISLTQQEKMFKMINEYFLKSKPRIVFILIDSRRGIGKQDEQIINYLDHLNHNLILLITKTDKAKQNELAKSLKHPFFNKYKYFLFSIFKKKSIEELRAFIEKIK